MTSLREQAETVFVEKTKMTPHQSLVNHMRGVAEICETIAKNMNEFSRKNGGEDIIDSEKAYISGLLHDIGKYEGHEDGLLHPVRGYKILEELEFSEIAHVALTHTFYGFFEVDNQCYYDEMTEEDVKFVQKYFGEHEIDDYDRLVQIADNMNNGLSKVMTISDRFCDILYRHEISSPNKRLKVLYELKEYFDKKIGGNIYELFRDDIIKSAMREPEI